MIRETAYYEEADSTETLDLYELLLKDGVSIDFWFPCGQQPTSMDLHVVFERGKETENAQVKVSPSKFYTLDDLTRLAAEWITEQEGDTEMLKWTFSIFIEWARKREREVGDG